MGIPLWKAVEVTVIWVVAVLFAVPEVVGFDMLEFPYRDRILRVCLMIPQHSSSFMKVPPGSALPRRAPEGLPEWTDPCYTTARQRREVADHIHSHRTLAHRLGHVVRTQISGGCEPAAISPSLSVSFSSSLSETQT